MITRLRRVEDWSGRAQAARYCLQVLAMNCGVSRRTLERWFTQHLGACPKDWLHDERMRRAVELLLDGSSVKETAACLAYRNQQHFSRDFKRHYGHPPGQPAALPLLRNKSAGGGRERNVANRHNLAQIGN